ncbi:oplophorus-luciferin 2-monooxygenase non-catalytic subunit-like [Ixodes scapularis]|uniref:oplophorus-luciferin 2-monooxygenase non-catalytic subunit-like n=1 Tax=Ixodes scapularis TaxID=6945 RepID=UPI001C3814ED|nr:oplophorus-luciferin 2-monooxygenase non-catalytic subunit-like [Ixodes scapularis]
MGCLLVAAVLCCFGILTVAQARSCPEAADFLPCTCDMGGIGCGKANSTAVLTKAFQTDGPKEHRDLWIQRSTVESFPPGVLGDFVFRNVYIEVNANLTSFNLSSLNKSRTFIMKLSLFGNALTTFAYSGIGGFPKLIMLNLGKNRLERIPDNAFQHPKLTKLVLSDNPIQAVGAYAFFALPKLEMLHLTGTRITRLGNYALSLRSRVPKLKVLLSEGNLASLSPLAFSDTRAQMLCLELNNLTEFPRDVFFPILEQLGQRRQVTWEVSTLRVTGNPFSCTGCSFKWLVDLKNQLLSRQLLSGFFCADGTSLARLSYAKIGC